MRIATTLAAVVLATVVLAADDKNIQFDATVDFSTIRTFAIRNTQINSEKPELNNRLFVQALEERARATLVSRGIKEVTDSPDVFVDATLAGQDFSGVRRGGPVLVPGSTRGGGRWVGTGPVSDRFTEGTLVIDITNRSGALVWRGTYRDEESSVPSLARKLPEDAKKLLSEFPPKR